MTTATPAKTKPATAPVKKTAKAPAKPAQTVAKTVNPAPAKPIAAKPGKPVTASEAKVDKKKDKVEKVKVVRDSFTIPKTEYAQIAAMKKRAVDLGLETKKSELIRAGLALLASTSEAAFRKALGNVPTLKTGRPGKV